MPTRWTVFRPFINRSEQLTGARSVKIKSLEQVYTREGNRVIFCLERSGAFHQGLAFHMKKPKFVSNYLGQTFRIIYDKLGEVSQ